MVNNFKIITKFKWMLVGGFRSRMLVHSIVQFRTAGVQSPPDMSNVGWLLVPGCQRRPSTESLLQTTPDQTIDLQPGSAACWGW